MWVVLYSRASILLPCSILWSVIDKCRWRRSVLIGQSKSTQTCIECHDPFRFKNILFIFLEYSVFQFIKYGFHHALIIINLNFHSLRWFLFFLIIFILLLALLILFIHFVNQFILQLFELLLIQLFAHHQLLFKHHFLLLTNLPQFNFTIPFGLQLFLLDFQYHSFPQLFLIN